MEERSAEKPIIGVSVSFHDFGDYQGVGPHRAIALAGGLPVMLARLRSTLDDFLELCDGIVLGNGRDIDPRFYGQAPSEKLGPTEPERDAFELELVSRALDRGLPMLGLCRGIQVLNVALGGTLVQDLGLVPDWAEHPSDRGWVRWKRVEAASLEDRPLPPHPRHPIAIEPGSRLRRALGADEAEVSSFHHQALDRVAPELRVVARAPDGVVEAVEMDDGYVLATQWELHEEWRIDRSFLGVFMDFVAACSDRRQERAGRSSVVAAAKASGPRTTLG